MNRLRFWKSPRKTYLVLAILAGLCAVLYIAYLLAEKTPEAETNSPETKVTESPTIERSSPQASLSVAIDSILFTFGIKPEWITTEKLQDQKKTATKAAWFTKVVLIPKGLSSVEINLDLSTYLKSAGLSSRVNEEIISKDVVFYINNPDTTQQLPAATIQIIHSDKAKRTDVIFSVILDRINEFSSQDLDKLIITKNEFSYIFPRNLDDIEIQHKLLQHKKDVLINLTLGGKDNYEADFNTSLDEKGIRDKIRNFNADFSTVSKVLLTKIENDAGLNQLQKKVTEELGKYNILVLNDTMITPVPEMNDNNNIEIFFEALVQKSETEKNIIAVYPVEKSEFSDFYNHVLKLKKLGYKFINLTDFFGYLKEKQKNEQESLEKQKQEQPKKKLQEDKKKKRNVSRNPVPKKESKKK